MAKMEREEWFRFGEGEEPTIIYNEGTDRILIYDPAQPNRMTVTLEGADVCTWIEKLCEVRRQYNEKHKHDDDQYTATADAAQEDEA